jgi:hypothetical protein
MKTSIWLITILALVLFQACSSNDFPKYQTLESLRVLGLLAPTPEVRAGSANVTVTPYVSDVNGAGRALTYTAEACLNPLIDYGAEPTCVGNPTRTVIATNAAVNVGANLTAANGFTGTVDSIGVAIPTATLLAPLDATLQYNGVPVLVTYTISASSGESVRAFRRILVTTDASKSLNTNPVLNDLLANGTAITTSLPTSSTSDLTPSYPTSGAGSPETYSVKSTDGSVTSVTETYTTTWFISSGTVKYARTLGASATQFTKPETLPASGHVVLVGVLRDGHDGISIVQKNLQ